MTSGSSVQLIPAASDSEEMKISSDEKIIVRSRKEEARSKSATHA